MADAAFAQLGVVLTGILDRLGQDSHRPELRVRFQSGDEFIPSHSKADALTLEETRHKHQGQYQFVHWSIRSPPPSDPSEPKRLSSLTTHGALKSLPMSAIVWCNENCFDISVCNAKKNIELFARQFPGEVIQMLMKGTYDDAVRGDSLYSRRLDHVIDLVQRAEPDWSTGTERWTHHGIEYTVTRAFLTKLDDALKSPNGMRGSPWSSIHPNDSAYPVHAPSPEYNDLGCYDANGPAVISSSPQPIAHNTMSEFTRATEMLPRYAPERTAPDGTHVNATPGIAQNLSVFHSFNMSFYTLTDPAPYFRVGTSLGDISVLFPDGRFSSLRPDDELKSLMPTYIVDDPARPPPCPCDESGKPFIIFDGTSFEQTESNPDFLLLRAGSARKDAFAAWWKHWHDRHPYRALPPVYVQYNPEYMPERTITRHEFNVFDLVIGTLLKTFAEKKKVRAYDLDCIERIRKFRPSKSYTKDIIDELLRELRKHEAELRASDDLGGYGEFVDHVLGQPESSPPAKAPKKKKKPPR